MIDWEYKRAEPKKLYNVYLIRHVFDYQEDVKAEIWHKDFIGQTWAKSEEQAETQVRYRNGDKYNFYADEYCEMWYEAEEIN